MKLHTGNPYWPNSDQLSFSFPTLSKNIHCDVLIIGGGITGALCAYYMNKANIDTVLIDKSNFASGSTMISTSILQYEIDSNLYNLSRIYDKQTALRTFHLCRKGIYDLKKIVEDEDLDAEFTTRRSLYVSRHFKDDIKLLVEYYSRKSAGFKVSFVNKNTMKKTFQLPYSSGIYSYDGGEINPYRFTRHLIYRMANNGVRAYEHTKLHLIDFKKDYNIVYTKDHSIKAKKVVFCTGYETDQLINKLVDIKYKTTYVITSKPYTTNMLWKDNCLIWEANRPYLYIRTTLDNRVIVGGLDTPYTGRLPSKKLLTKKWHTLKEKANKLFPHLNVQIDYYSAGVFAETKDDLGYIGEHKDFPNCYFDMCYGANGTLHSVFGAEMIRDLYLYGDHPDLAIFSLYR